MADTQKTDYTATEKEFAVKNHSLYPPHPLREALFAVRAGRVSLLVSGV
jgi:hypothetical protein